ncbi:hypothetical protein ACFL6O_01340 [candidate division KSB1 bacterium]
MANKKSLDLEYEASCLNCKFWEERSNSDPKKPAKLREGVCRGKFSGDYITGHQYCLGFEKK